MRTTHTFLQEVPHLTTALSGPLEEIELQLLHHQNAIETWFRQQWIATPAPFYASIDLRNAGYKLAPVDTNLFPAGFNNLNPAFDPLCIHAIQSSLQEKLPHACRILLIPENHTRNPFYLENIAKLLDLLNKAGYETRLGLFESESATIITLMSGRELLLEPITLKGSKLTLENFNPCAVILNNDLCAGVPDQLLDIDQPILPPPKLGWSHRFKSNHFSHYSQVVREFCQIVPIDSWLIDPLYRNCGEIDFQKRTGEDCVFNHVRALIQAVKTKYDEHGINEEPFAVVKADRGTYGMGVIMVQDADEVENLNRKQRKKLSSMKEGLEVSRVIIQEGVHTFETVGDDNHVAEPVIYTFGHFVVGGFYRVHKERSRIENLNAPGMHFEPLAFADSCSTPDATKSPDAQPNRFYAYGVIARLALLAAAREIAEAGRSS